MKNSTVYAVIVGVVVVAVLVRARLAPLGEHATMAVAIAAVNSKLPKAIDEITTETRVELKDHTLTSYYTISRPMDNDATVTTALHDGVTKKVCANAETRKLLAKGYSLVNVYGVTTPHGPDRITVSIKATDCG
jgi:hypothetical protein